ncbi:MAG TPA: hypothetical protein VME42_15290 [Steroidobacteraceae bacterium]|nr:hypothetical protein [Steroidobacteraceae bacterium]
MAASNRHRVAGIDPENIVEEYRGRALKELSDAQLFDQIRPIVARPPARGLTSFTLHAPLELMARFGLLRLVDPAQRELARLQMVASASVYGRRVDAMPAPARVDSFPDASTAARELARTFASGDADGMEARVLSVALQFGTPSLVDLLTPLALPTLTGASHSHIGLWLLLLRAEPVGAEDASLLRAAARALAADPTGRMKSFRGMSIEATRRLETPPEQVSREILDKLASPAKGTLGGESIRELVEAVERTGNADALFGDFILHDLSPGQIAAAFRAVLRVSAHSMLQHDLEQAKFGWSHCLTLPQSAFGLSGVTAHRKLALAAALVWITAYRCVLSDRPLDLRWQPRRVEEVSVTDALRTSPAAAASRVWHASDGELPAIRRILATEAAVRNDTHLVKYTRACLDMGALDPEHVRLYLAAAAHLCALWMAEAPRATIEESLLAGRSTQYS